jgi:ribonuclease HI
MVSTKCIKANPDKIKVIIQMQPPRSRKDVQKLIGRIASLNRFISKLVERSLPFFTILRGSVNIEWGAEQRKAFNDLKSYLQHLPTLSNPEQEQPLILYVSAMHSAISGALVTEKEIMQNGKTAKQQFLVYLVLEVLTGSKRFYSEMEKICYAVIMSVCKLQYYFEAHTIRIPTSPPLIDIFRNKDSSGRISKWAMELLDHVVDFEKRSAIKSQILVDFVAEWM